MKIGIIGTGWVTGLHLDALKLIEGAEVVAIAGRKEDRAKELADPWKAKTYVDPLTMLQKESLDAAFILLPPHLQAIEQSQAGACAAAILPPSRGVSSSRHVAREDRSRQLC